MPAFPVPTNEPRVEVRFVLPHDFLLDGLREVRDADGRLTELVIIPKCRRKNDWGHVGHLVAEDVDAFGNRHRMPPREVEARYGMGLKLETARRDVRTGMPAGPPLTAADRGDES